MVKLFDKFHCTLYSLVIGVSDMCKCTRTPEIIALIHVYRRQLLNKKTILKQETMNLNKRKERLDILHLYFI